MGNTTTTNNKKKKSNARKLIPAIGMLMTSAAMLTTSTYAWFTMNKEVSITGITLTASVPETLEISLGSKTTTPSQNSESHVISVTKPSNDDSGSDWSNTVDIATYYRVNSESNKIDFGQLVPVSSTDGFKMFFTSDAIGDGRDLKDTATFTKEEGQLINSGPNRYYLDIPVWFRSTATSASASDVSVNLSVSAEIKTNDSTELYKAARVSILSVSNADENNETITESNGGVIMDTEASYNSSVKKENEDKPAAVNAQGTISKNPDNTTNKLNFYDAVDPVVQTGNNDAETVVQVPKRKTDTVSVAGYGDNNKRHGDMVKRIVRIWLEGEDVACYNPNAGQSFSISLEFQDKAAQTNQSGQSNS